MSEYPAAPEATSPGGEGQASKPADRGLRVLFIDFDGVLHPAPSTAFGPSAKFMAVGHFGWLPILVRLLRDHPDVRVVVHSSWREVYDEAELGELLFELGDRYSGAVPRGDRYSSILKWLAERPEVERHLIVDDDPREFPDPAPATLVLCQPDEGVSGADVMAAIQGWLEA